MELRHLARNSGNPGSLERTVFFVAQTRVVPAHFCTSCGARLEGGSSLSAGLSLCLGHALWLPVGKAVHYQGRGRWQKEPKVNPSEPEYRAWQPLLERANQSCWPLRSGDRFPTGTPVKLGHGPWAWGPYKRRRGTQRFLLRPVGLL